jgi:hypothetical protein
VERPIDVTTGKRLDRGDPSADRETRGDGFDLAGGAYQSRSG